MASFINLPTELRLIIIRHTLHHRRESPPTPSTSNRDHIEDFKPVAESWQLGGCGVYYEESHKHCPTNCLPLLLTNRQISAETKSVLSRMETDYVLDISVLNDIYLFPTWITVPRLSHRVNHLRAEVRLFGHIITDKAARTQMGDGGRNGIHFAFHQILQRFLMYGPVGEKKGRDNDGYENKNISVRVLELDFTSAEEAFPFPPEKFDWRDYNRQLIGHGKLEGYKPRPEWMARWICKWIRRILAMDSYGMIYGSMIYENVGTLRVLADGILIEELDLSHCPKGALARREELGFPVMRPKLEDQES
ncbi:hypothetical protein PENFLA_c027G03680 [Penicillium flavigenum]|uniref:F-box domain-containing protein n=1 Tax=Penicillium flavigenum TaxID=254877 RepID=A0A1V6SR67_9EURO|nr:hypothetical protein PENFLA_c027G03680 [Penicillium flavigenum]